MLRHWENCPFQNKEQYIKEVLENTLNDSFVGELGHVYGEQWRKYPDYKENNLSLDQIMYLIYNIKQNPNSRYHIVTSWNPIDFIVYPKYTALPACHMLFQCYIRNGKYLDLKMIQRSCDTFLGVPFNIASYALLTHIIADLTGFLAGEFIWSGNDIHYYENQEEQVTEILTKEPKNLPILNTTSNYDRMLEKYLSKKITLDEFFNSIEIKDFSLSGYESHGKLKAPLSVGI